MVIGDGMMARAFSAFNAVDDVVIFASGVSNSLETDNVKFARERELLLRIRQEYPKALLVYFGSCSASDPDRAQTPYVHHKMEIESLVARSTGNYLILRLHLAIGPNKSAKTLDRFLYDRILRGEAFEVWTKAVRYPIDIQDAVRIARRLIDKSGVRDQLVNVALRPYGIFEFVRAMERIVGRKAKCRLLEKGAPFMLECPEVANLTQELQLDYTDEYLEKTLNKYYTQCLGDREFSVVSPGSHERAN